MSTLRERACTACKPGTPTVDPATATRLLSQLAPDWAIAPNGKSLERTWKFADFHQTMAFVNAVAWIANAEDHHPDMEVGYNYCRIEFSTHSVGGLSENDFICAAKLDAL